MGECCNIWQGLELVISLLRKLRFPLVCGWIPKEPVIESVDTWAQVLYFISVPCMIFAFGMLCFDKPGLVGLLILVGLPFNTVVWFSIVYWHRDTPFSLLGAKVRCMVDVIPMTIAAALHHLFEFNYVYLALILSSTAYLHVLLHSMHIAYDIGLKDLLWGIVIEVLVYILSSHKM